MIIEINGDINKFQFGATGIDEVVQNVAFILKSYRYSCPMDRAFGHGDSLDSPIQLAQASIRSEITNAIEQYEPRVEVLEISFSDENNGQLKPTVKVQIHSF